MSTYKHKSGRQKRNERDLRLRNLEKNKRTLFEVGVTNNLNININHSKESKEIVISNHFADEETLQLNPNVENDQTAPTSETVHTSNK